MFSKEEIEAATSWSEDGGWSYIVSKLRPELNEPENTLPKPLEVSFDDDMEEFEFVWKQDGRKLSMFVSEDDIGFSAWLGFPDAMEEGEYVWYQEGMIVGATEALEMFVPDFIICGPIKTGNMLSRLADWFKYNKGNLRIAIEEETNW